MKKDSYHNNTTPWTPLSSPGKSNGCMTLLRISCNSLSASVFNHQFFLKSSLIFQSLFSVVSSLSWPTHIAENTSDGNSRTFRDLFYTSIWGTGPLNLPLFALVIVNIRHYRQTSPLKSGYLPIMFCSDRFIAIFGYNILEHSSFQGTVTSGLQGCDFYTITMLQNTIF